MPRLISSQLRLVSLFAVFVLPFATVFYLLATEINERKGRAEKELTGLIYIEPVRHLLEDFTRYRSITIRMGEAPSAANLKLFKEMRDHVKKSVEAVDKVDQNLGSNHILATTKQWMNVKSAWIRLQERTPEAGASGLLAETEGLIQSTQQMIRLAGDTSSLILDPELDTYYFMDGVVMRLPKLTDDTAKTRDLAMRMAGKRNVSREERRELNGLVQVVRESQAELHRGMQVAFDSNAELKQDLETQSQSSSFTNEFLAQVEIFGGEPAPAGVGGYPYGTVNREVPGGTTKSRLTETADKALKQQWLVYDRLILGLGNLLENRIDSLTRRLLFVEMFSLIVLLVTTYVFYQFARSTRARTEAETELRLAESKFRAIFENAIEGIFQTTTDGKYLSANPALARIYGYNKVEELMHSVGNIGRQLYVDPARRGEFLRLIQEKGEVTEFESQVYRRDGTTIWISEKAHVVRDENGVVTHFEGTVEDISERKRFQQELVAARDAAEDANRTKSQFLANMSHELRTPLNAIIGYSEMLQEEAEDLDQPSFVPDLQKIHSAGKHLLTLINDVLDLSKIEAGKMELFLEDFQVPDMVREVTATIMPLVEKGGNRLEVTLDPAVGSMRADLTKIRQNLFNLLSNACKFTENGLVQLTVNRIQVGGTDMVEFRVEDSGIGMTDDQLSRLFQAFSQADASTTRKYGGTGLGLAITRKFCEMMGGGIEATSTPGQGSTFVIRIPEQVPEPAQQENNESSADLVSAVPATAAADAARGLVLVIDDDPTIHDMMRRNLSREGFRVVTASSGPEGLEMARKLRPSVITLDVMMPGMDGWAVLSTLKADSSLADIPVIMVTMLEDKTMGFALGATDYVTKPFDRDRLSGILRRYARPSGDSLGRVLVVEDDNATRDMLRRLLEREHWTVEVAANGRLGMDTLERMGDDLPRLILLDLMMPEMDGFTFVELLQQNDLWRAIPVVVVTAKDIDATDRQRLHGTVQQILQKGAYSRDDLLQQVRRLVSARVQEDN